MTKLRFRVSGWIHDRLPCPLPASRWFPGSGWLQAAYWEHVCRWWEAEHDRRENR